MAGIPTEASLIPDTDESSLLDIVEQTRLLCKRMPAGHVYLTSDGGDFSFFLDTAAMSSNRECPVLMYGPGAMGVQVADSFLDFAEKLAKRPSFGPDGRMR
jgi:hypothetical protein